VNSSIAALPEAVRCRINPPSRKSVAEIARDTGITPQTIHNWRSLWQQQGQRVPASIRPPQR
jgi:transposase